MESLISEKITRSLNPEKLEILDLSNNCGAIFNLTIVSEKFEGKKLLERHRLVNSSLGDTYNQIHALSIKCYTMGEYKSLS
ncbi:hypothetical protein cand_008980 [Cryptosporidium andersoni]|uniref:BolA-like domain-containing protein n=1 Tax=Cryptosporidium andersoni TaxID=117008 RepID=A0A1J4MTK8_9CRYT|nr:hypothetical protein cand_008980 [Cryptosporidium andersoni]